MLSFSTEFPVAANQTSTAFLDSVKDWILGSPHTRITSQDIEVIYSHTQSLIQQGNETLETLRFAKNGKDLASVKYKRFNSGLEWTTTVNFSQTERDAWVAIRVYCDSSHPSTSLPLAKKPVLVRTLLQKLGGGEDGDLQVGENAVFLTNAEIDKAALIIQGTTDFRLPVVYVSSTFQGKYVLEPNRLAKALAGVAHVVVEPNRAFSLRLKIEANSENVYGGAVGIYWPDGGGRRSFFLGPEYENARDLEKSILEEVRLALNNRRPLDRCTWASIQEMVSRQALDELKNSGSSKVEEYMEVFDKELSSKDEKLSDAEREIARLKADLRIFESRTPSGSGITLKSGSEQDLYPNEISEIILDALKYYQSQVTEDSRRSHILSDLLRTNKSTFEAETMKSRITDILRSYTSLTPTIKNELESLGFEISVEGKHYQIMYHGDDRYTFTLSKSGSDNRGGLNAAKDIGRLFF